MFIMRSNIKPIDYGIDVELSCTAHLRLVRPLLDHYYMSMGQYILASTNR